MSPSPASNNDDNTLQLLDIEGIVSGSHRRKKNVFGRIFHEDLQYDGDDEDSILGDFTIDEVEEATTTIMDSGFNGVGEEEISPEELESIAGVIETMRALDGKQDLSGLDHHVKKRIRDFRYAQKQRCKKNNFHPFGIVGLYTSLSDIRSDLRWAEHVAHRKRKRKTKLSWEEYETRRRERGFKRPFFAYLLVVLNIAMFVFSLYWSGWQLVPFNVNPLLGPDPEVFVQLGALHTRKMIETGTYYRIFTAIFLHGGFFHLVINIGALFLLSRIVERNHGYFQASFLFLIPAIGGNVVSGVMQPNYILLGASGGLFGLIGVLVADIVLNWKLMFLIFKQYRGRSGCWIRFQCLFWLIFDLFINSVVGFTPFVDNFAHMGGLTYGFLMALTILSKIPFSFFGAPSSDSHQTKILALRLLGVILSFFLLLLTTGLLIRSDGTKAPCTTCLYVSCIPFPFWGGEDKWWRCDGCDSTEGEIFRNRGDLNFSDLSLQCPDGEIEYIDIYADQFSNPVEVEAALPEYCRQYCGS